VRLVETIEYCQTKSAEFIHFDGGIVVSRTQEQFFGRDITTNINEFLAVGI
jgi:hypothetical protein